MKALYQRLKELDTRTFEQFCFQLLKERHPGIEIKRVEGSGGDEGIDCFEGEIDGRLHIWQCKSFADGIREPQKKQIRKSLRQAAKHSGLQGWVLCVSVDLTPAAHRWFEKLRGSYSCKFQIGLLDASHIVNELIHRKTLREVYFPEAVLDLRELRGLITGAGALSDSELATLGEENAHQYIQRLKDRDARFTYEISFGSDRGPQPEPLRPGAMLSISDHDKVINVFPRDFEALRVNPPKVTFGFSSEGTRKMNELILTGRSQDFGPGEIVAFKSDFDFMRESGNQLPNSMQLSKRGEASQVPMRLTFGNGAEAVMYEYVEFEIISRGTRQAELVSVGDIPFEIGLLIDMDGVTITFKSKFEHAEVRSIAKVLTAVSAARKTRCLEFFDLRHEKRLAGTVTALPEWDNGYLRFIHDAAAVADRYDLSLRLPSELKDEDVESLIILKQLRDGVFVDSGDITFVMTKKADNDAAFQRLLTGSEIGIRLQRPNYEPVPVIFGVRVQTGPIIAQCENAKLKNLDEARKSWETAKDGDDIQLALEHPGKIRLSLA